MNLDQHILKAAFYSGLDKDLDQWVFHPLLFNLVFYSILKISNCRECKALLKDPIFALHILKKSCKYQIHVAFLGKLPRFIQLAGLWKYHARLVRPGPISFRTS